jgi:hypothetical protein
MTFPKFWELFFSSLVRADPPSRTVVLTTDSGSTWTVPADWNNADNSIACIGGGGGGEMGTINGGGGGAGGGYSSISNLALTRGATVTLQVGTAGAAGTAGGDTWFNGANPAASSVAAVQRELQASARPVAKHPVSTGVAVVAARMRVARDKPGRSTLAATAAITPTAPAAAPARRTTW